MFVLFRNCPLCGSEQTKSVKRQEAGGGGGGLGANSQWGKSCLLLIRKKHEYVYKRCCHPIGTQSTSNVSRKSGSTVPPRQDSSFLCARKPPTCLQFFPCFLLVPLVSFDGKRVLPLGMPSCAKPLAWGTETTLGTNLG